MAGPQSESPSTIDRWLVAVVTIYMIRDLDGAEFRERVDQLATALRDEGIAAHRCADRREGMSAFSEGPSASTYTREEILARLSRDFKESDWRVAAGYLARLSDGSLEDPQQLRQQAAIILDASQLLCDVLAWYADRVMALYPSGRGHLENDTIATIMVDWGVTPTETQAALAERGLVVTVGALAMALKRKRELDRAGVDGGLTVPWRIELLP